MALSRSQVLPQTRPVAGDGVTAEPGDLRARRWFLDVALLAGAAVLAFLYYRMLFPGLVNPDALGFAQLARNLSEGRGFTTYTLMPLALSHGANPAAQPDLTHGPLYPLLLALAFGSPLGAKESTAAILSGLFYVLTVPLVYLLGTRLFSRQVGYLAALVFAVNSLALEYSISGLPITLYVFLTTALLLVVQRLAAAGGASGGFPRGQFALLGALAALLYLTDPIFIFAVPVVLVTAAWLGGARRLPAAAICAGVFLLLAGPWMLRFGRLTGNPFLGLRGAELFMFTGAYPGDMGYRLLPGELTAGGKVALSVLRKYLQGVNEVIQGLPQISAVWVLAFFLPGLFFRFTDRAANQTRTVMIALLLSVVAGSLLFRVEMWLVVAVMPGLLVFALACLAFLIEQAQLSRGATFAAFAILGLAVTYPVLGDLFLEPKTPPVAEAGSAATLADRVGRDEAILTDRPDVAAWYAQRPAVAIPAEEASIARLRGTDGARLKGVHWLFLTPEAANLSPAWGQIYSAFTAWNYGYAQAAQRLQEASVEARRPLVLEFGGPDPSQWQIREPAAGEGAGNGQLQLKVRQQLRINASASADPLVKALSGFTWTPPRAGSDLSVAVATASPAALAGGAGR